MKRFLQFFTFSLFSRSYFSFDREQERPSSLSLVSVWISYFFDSGRDGEFDLELFLFLRFNRMGESFLPPPCD